ncbi:MAG: ATP synthase F1 subunit epsilon [Ignavibacteria bacterium]
MKELYLEVTTPSKTAYSGNIQSVTVPGTLGSFQVLYNHAPIISSLETGMVKIVGEDGSTKYFAMGGGTVEVLNNKVSVLAESFESPAEIDIERAKRAKERAKERLKTKDIDFDRAQAALIRSMNRIDISGKYSRI